MPMNTLYEIVRNTGWLFLEAAPWLLLGLVIAGLIRAFVPEARMAGWLGGRGLWPTIKAALIGAPLPLCSCSVIPVAMGLHRGGASRASTTSFLIATPETGADSIGASYALLGPFFTVLRPVAAITSAIVTGLVSNFVPAKNTRQSTATPTSCCSPPPPDNCCERVAPADNDCTANARPTRSSDAEAAGDCCAGARPAAAAAPSWAQRLADGMHYAITQILDEFGLWLVAGLVVAGVTLTLVPPETLSGYGQGLPAMLVLLAASIPLYVCATQSTPIATALLAAGVSPGAVLVFLLAGPATNLATIGAVRQEFGGVFAVCYLSSMALCALAFGLGTDAFLAWSDLELSIGASSAHALLPLWLSLPAAIALVALSIGPLRAPLLRRMKRRASAAEYPRVPQPLP